MSKAENSQLYRILGNNGNDVASGTVLRSKPSLELEKMSKKICRLLYQPGLLLIAMGIN